MEMSLDDIIKQNRKNKKTAGGNKRQGPGGNKRQGPGGNKRQGAGGKKVTPRAKPNTKGGSPKKNGPSRKNGPIRNGKKPGGGVIRNRSQGAITKKNRRPANFSRAVPSFLGSNGTRRFGGSEVTKLIVSNLDYGVTDSDILELFGEFGQLKSAGVHYDRSGRSMGSADLIFERRNDALKVYSLKQLHQTKLIIPTT